MTTLGFVLDGLLVAVAAVGTVTDLTRRKIYDWLTYPALVLGLLLQAIGFGWGGVFDPGLVSSISGAGFCMIVFGAFWMWGKGFGAGDVKLMAALGSITGFVDALTLAMCAALVGALMALARLFLTRSGWVRARSWFRRKKEGEDKPDGVTVPYGLAIGIGVVWSLLIKYKLVAGLIP